MNDDRRKTRSHDPLVALHYQLSAARKRGALDTLVVADASGLLVAGSGAWPACEELAAFAPLLVGAVEVPVGAASRLETLRGEVRVTSVEVDGDAVLLCARGDAGADLDDAARGVRRILLAA